MWRHGMVQEAAACTSRVYRAKTGTRLCCLLQAEVVALQTHQQTLQAAKAAAGKAGGPGAAGKAATTAAAPPPPAAAAAKQTAPAGKRKPGEAQAAAGSKGA